jgi:hypothetical protein
MVGTRVNLLRHLYARAAISSTRSGRLVADVADFFSADSGSGRTLARSATLVPAPVELKEIRSRRQHDRQIRSTARVEILLFGAITHHAVGLSQFSSWCHEDPRL